MASATGLEGRPLLLAGRWESTGEWLPTGENGTRVAQAGPAEVDAAIDEAKGALKIGLAPHQRAGILDRAAALVDARSESLARLVSREVAKPISLARGEVRRAVETLSFSAAAVRSQHERTAQIDAAEAGKEKLAFSRLVPRGVVGAITPFNFPVNLVLHKLAPAIAAGCPVVLKPAPAAPLAALELAELLAEAGLPEGWLSVLPGPAEEVGGRIVEHPDVPVLSFTGSVAVGWAITERAPRKKILLELGGSAPAVVTADADLGPAADKLATNGFSFAGQSCVSVQRIYVQDEVVEEFIAQLLARVAGLGVGDPSDPEVVCGPVIDQAAADRLSAWIDEARRAGARVLAGGQAVGRLLEPTVLADVPEGARLIQGEAFGPVISVNPFSTLEEAFALANGTPFGLQAAVFTSSLATAMAATETLDFGAVLVNEAPTFRADHMPYGGRGDSGNTREGPESVVQELTEERLVVLDISGSRGRHG